MSYNRFVALRVVAGNMPLQLPVEARRTSRASPVVSRRTSRGAPVCDLKLLVRCCGPAIQRGALVERFHVVGELAGQCRARADMRSNNGVYAELACRW